MKAVLTFGLTGFYKMCYRVTNEELRRGELIEINKRSFSQVTGSDAGSLAFSVPKLPYNYIIYIIPY